MPIPDDAQTALSALLDKANDHEESVIRGVAIRAGLLQHCRCGWYNHPEAERCDNCRTLVLPTGEPRTIPAVGLIAVRDYLIRVHGAGAGDADGAAQFVAACRTGACGAIALEVADEVFVGADHYTYRHVWKVIAEEIIAGVETHAIKTSEEVATR